MLPQHRAGVVVEPSTPRPAGDDHISDPAPDASRSSKSVAGTCGPAHPDRMDLTDAARTWQADGFVILPGFIPIDELAPAVEDLGVLFPSAAGFHDGTDPRRERFLGDEFAGIDTFPFASTAISLLAVNHRLLHLAGTLLGDSDIHLYTAEAW